MSSQLASTRGGYLEVLLNHVQVETKCQREQKGWEGGSHRFATGPGEGPGPGEGIGGGEGGGEGGINYVS